MSSTLRRTLDFDCVIVGAGSAGCVIAARLSENPDRRVLLLEAGGSDWNPMVHIPLGVGETIRRGLHGWGLVTEPSPGLNGRKLAFPRGKLLGGTSSINGMIYVRGNPRDYDEMATFGNGSWSYRDVLPYFKRSESHAWRSDEFHGRSGPLRICTGAAENPIYDAFLEAGARLGYPATDDFNGARQEGFGRYDFTIDRGRRQSSAVAFLRPAKGRPNLTVLTRALACRILVERSRARGVEFLRRGRRYVARAENVVLCAGAIHSPHLLMLSGIGEPSRLRAVGVPVAHELPGVGRNLHDHTRLQIDVGCARPVTLHTLTRIDRISVAALEAMLFRRGPATCFPAEVGAFTKIEEDDNIPEAQWFCYLGTSRSRVRWPGRVRTAHAPGESFAISAVLLRCESVGEVRLRSPDPGEPPLIFPNLLAATRDLDRMVVIARRVQDLLHQPSFRGLATGIIAGPPASARIADERSWVRANATSSSHPVGTCRMGNDALAVVDDRLNVHGLEDLRVADASVLPFTPRGNTNAPTIMVAERAADFIADTARFKRKKMPAVDRYASTLDINKHGIGL